MKLQSETFQEIRYEEPWIGSYTLKQLLFLLPFLLLGYYILFHSSLVLTTRAIAALLPVTVGLYLVHLEYDKKLSYLLAYLFRRKKHSLKNPYSLFRITDFRDDVIVASDKLIAALRVFPIDFHLKSDSKKENIIRSYHQFLNSLNYSVQILALIRKQRLSNYFSGLKDKTNPNFREHVEDLEHHFTQLVKNRELYIREYFLLIPYLLTPKTDYRIALEELGKRADACEKRLQEGGFHSKRLGTNNLITLFGRAVR